MEYYINTNGFDTSPPKIEFIDLNGGMIKQMNVKNKELASQIQIESVKKQLGTDVVASIQKQTQVDKTKDKTPVVTQVDKTKDKTKDKTPAATAAPASNTTKAAPASNTTKAAPATAAPATAAPATAAPATAAPPAPASNTTKAAPATASNTTKAAPATAAAPPAPNTTKAAPATAAAPPAPNTTKALTASTASTASTAATASTALTASNKTKTATATKAVTSNTPKVPTDKVATDKAAASSNTTKTVTDKVTTKTGTPQLTEEEKKKKEDEKNKKKGTDEVIQKKINGIIGATNNKIDKALANIKKITDIKKLDAEIVAIKKAISSFENEKSITPGDKEKFPELFNNFILQANQKLSQAENEVNAKKPVQQVTPPPVAKQNITPPVVKQEVTPQVAKQDVTPQVAKQDVTPQVAKQEVTPPVVKQEVAPPVAKQDVAPQVAKQEVAPPVESSQPLKPEVVQKISEGIKKLELDADSISIINPTNPKQKFCSEILQFFSIDSNDIPLLHLGSNKTESIYVQGNSDETTKKTNKYIAYLAEKVSIIKNMYSQLPQADKDDEALRKFINILEKSIKRIAKPINPSEPQKYNTEKYNPKIIGNYVRAIIVYVKLLFKQN